jgi:hypothetical protein
MTEEIGTVHILDQVQKHLLPLFPGAQTAVYRAEEHDSFRTGMPVGAVEVVLGQEGFMIYTCPGVRVTVGGLREVQRFALDQLRDLSDPDVGMYAYEPVEHGQYDTLGCALTEIARRFAAEVVGNSLHEEEEVKMLQDSKNG